MQKIIASIKQNETGFAVANLQDALFAMMKHGYISPMPPGEHPSKKDLQILSEKLKDERSQSLYGEATAQLIFYFQLQNGLGDNLRGLLVDGKTAEKLNEFLDAHGLIDNSNIYIVRGKITDQYQKPIKELTVKAYDRDLRTAQLLGEAVTDDSGNYKIEYQANAIALAENTAAAPDLMVIVSDQSQAQLVESEIRFNASHDEVFDFILTMQIKTESEWEILTAKISPLLIGQGKRKPIYMHVNHNSADSNNLAPYELNAQDITFIVKDTGLDLAAIQAWVDASCMVRDGVALLGESDAGRAKLLQSNGWSYFYAFSRQNLARTLQAVLQRSEEDWKRTWLASLAANQVPKIDDASLKRLGECLAYLNKINQISITSENPHLLAKVIKAAGVEIPRSVGLSALSIIEEHGIDNPELLLKSLIGSHPDQENTIKPFVQGVRLYQLTDGDQKLIYNLGEHSEDKDDSIASLAKLPQSDWIAISAQSNKGLLFAADMQRRVELQHPVVAVQSRIEDKKLLFSKPILDGINKLLKSNTSRVNSLLTGITPIKEKELPDAELTLKNLGIFMRAGINMELAGKLMTKGIDTPAMALNLGAEKLIDVVKEIDSEHDYNELIGAFIKSIDKYVKAGQDIIIRYGDHQRLPPYFYVDEDDGQPLTPEEKELLPDIPSLFGDLDACICRPCESMLGQPAYLVDLLELLRDLPKGNALPLQDKLKERRPDIFKLPLSCENAETEVQHIDLVLEILEQAAAPQGTSATNIKSAAYQQTKNSNYPWSLPFELDWAEAQAYTRQLKFDQVTLLKLLSGTNLEQDSAVVTLDVSSKEWGLFTTEKSGNDLWNQFGLTSTTSNDFKDPTSNENLPGRQASEVLTRVSVLLDRTGLNLDQFEQLIVTEYVGKATITNREQCKTSEMKLAIPNSLTQEQVLNRIHRMVRLRSKCPDWSFGQLDMVINACGGLDLPKLACIKRILDRCRLTSSFFSPLSSTKDMLALLGKALNLRQDQFQLLALIGGFNTSDPLVDWLKLEKALILLEQIQQAKLSIEDFGLAILPASQVQQWITPLPPKFINNSQATDYLQKVQVRLHDLSNSVTGQANIQKVLQESLPRIIAELSAISEVDATTYLKEYLLVNDGVTAETLFLNQNFWGSNSTIDPLLVTWCERLNRLLLLKAKLSATLFQTVLPGIAWHKALLVAGSSIDECQRLLDFLWLCDSLRLSVPVVESLIAIPKNSSTGFKDAVALLARRIGYAADAEQLINLLGITTRQKLLDFTQLKRAYELLVLAKTLEATSTQISKLSTINNPANQKDIAIELLRTKYHLKDDASWVSSDIRAKVENFLSKCRRDALVAYLIQNSSGKWLSANDLYEHHLIDPMVEPCMKTTRVLETITAVQLFAQRILFGLEKGLFATSKLKQQWTWMRNYRVWEANRKVFLFPENWLYPELRDDKSSSFLLLESELGRGELTGDLADEAFTKFLEDVAQMGKVQVVGLYEDVGRDQLQKLNKRDLYVIGRTPNSPYSYYWKKCTDFGAPLMEWLPWRKIELEINGDHVIPFVLNGTLNIAWLLISRITDKDGSLKQIELKIAKSRLQGLNWEKPVISRNSQLISPAPYRDDRDGYALRVRVDNINGFDLATVSCYVASSQLSSSAPTQECQSDVSEFSQLPEHLPNNTSVTIHIDSPDTHLPVTSWPPEFGKADRSAFRKITGECWIKLKTGENYGWMRLDPSRTSGHKIELRSADTSIPSIPYGGDHSWLDLGDDSQAAAKQNISPYGAIEVSTWALHANFHGVVDVSLTSISTLDCQRTDTGSSRIDHFIFNIDASEYTAEELGLEYDGLVNFIKSVEFYLDDTSEIMIGSASGPLFSPPDTKAYMNGYRENLSGSNASALFIESYHADGPFLGTAVFPASNKSRFFAVAANSNRAVWESESIWHFHEQNGAAFIDFAPRRSSTLKEFRLLPHFFTEALAFSIGWRRDRLLPLENKQFALYGADELPKAGPLLLTDTYLLAQDGTVNVTKQKELTFDPRLPYSIYTWEIFFHAPLLIADQLSKQHKFEEAERWLRYVFDPTSKEAGDPTSFLKFQPFKSKEVSRQVIDDLKAIALAAGGYVISTNTDAIERIINRWRNSPFRPFAIARGRIVAFLWRTLFAYLDNLIAWADSLYRRDTRESNNEAMMLYMLAWNILGRSPKTVPGKSKRPGKTYEELAGHLDSFANYWVDVGSRLPARHYKHKGMKNGESDDGVIIFNPVFPTSSGMLLFCLPVNYKLTSYWNIVEERLFNLRHCRNIEGIERELPLMDFPIDPELLIRATAAGLDLASVIADLYAPPPHYRYATLASRANELVGEAKALGGALLSAMEKRDSEQIAQLRSNNEINLLKLTSDVRKLQISEAEANIKALRATRRSTESRYNQYQRLLGLNGIAPEEGEAAGQVAMLGHFDEGAASKRTGLGLIKEENEQYLGIDAANTWSMAASISKAISGVTHAGAAVAVVAGWADPKDTGYKIAESVAQGASALGDGFSVISQGWRTYADQQGMLAGHLRRRDEWAFQSNQVLKELQQIDKQILANQIRIDISRKELENQLEQIEQSQALDEVLRSKFTNVQLYEWMTKELYGLYDKTYRMALSLARQAESAAERELGVKKGILNKIGNAHWNSQREGLLAAEKLQHDLKSLEVVYMDKNHREFELTKHISLRRLDPEALVNLRMTQVDANGDRVNQCEFKIPEWLFDLDTPGHYLRRIKSVSVSIPCVVGPYSSVHCKLTMLKSSLRYEPNFTSALDDTFGLTEAVVTSTANADSGMFETQLRDERFLPFEGRGVISTWRLELPAQFKQFDYSTISDAILTIRYTARDGGVEFQKVVTNGVNVQGKLPECAVLLSCRSDFPTQWVQRSKGITIPISIELLPYWLSAEIDAEKASIKAVEYLTINDSTEEVNFLPAEKFGDAEAKLSSDDLSAFDEVLVKLKVSG